MPFALGMDRPITQNLVRLGQMLTPVREHDRHER
jgi:hypothetical protein